MQKKIIFFIGFFCTFQTDLILPEPDSFSAQVLKCNGDPSFCGRRLNEITYIDSHNSNSCKQCLVQDQSYTIEQQLQMGVRVFKLPIHCDYVNPLGYYKQLFEALFTILNNKINSLSKEIEAEHPTLFGAIHEAENKIKTTQRQIDDLNRQIAEVNAQYNKLPKFSLTEIGNSAQYLKYESRLKYLNLQKTSLETLKSKSMAALEDLDKEAQVIDPIKTKSIVELQAQISIASIPYQFALKNVSPNAAQRKIFACHALPKNELYDDHTSDLIDNAPDLLKKVLQPIKEPLKNAIKNLATTLFGNTKDAGGLIPYTPCLLDRGRMPLIDICKIYKNFLDNNRNEIIIIKFNDFAKNIDDLAATISASGLTQYAHTQNANQEWPMLQEMIQRNKRLVLFIDQTGGGGVRYPWIHDQGVYMPWRVKYDFKKVSEITQAIGSNFNASDEIKMQYIEQPGQPKNKFLGLSHGITPGIAADKNMANQINRRAIIEARALEYYKATRHIVNFISLDFITPNSEIFDTVNEMNSVGKYSGKPFWPPLTK